MGHQPRNLRLDKVLNEIRRFFREPRSLLIVVQPSSSTPNNIKYAQCQMILGNIEHIPRPVPQLITLHFNYIHVYHQRIILSDNNDPFHCHEIRLA